MAPQQQQQSKPNGSDGDTSLADLSKSLGGMAEQFKALPSLISQAVVQGIDSYAQQQRQQQQQQQDDPDDDPDKGGDPVDFEKLSRAELVEHIVGRIEKGLDKRLKGVNQKVEQTGTEIQKSKIQERFKEARAQYKDFDEWKDEMGKYVQEKGYLDPDELYILVRAKNPTKAQELDKKYEESDKGDQDANNASNKGASDNKKAGDFFLGLMPTNSSRTADENKPKYESTKQAAEAAFDEVMGKLPDNLTG